MVVFMILEKITVSRYEQDQVVQLVKFTAIRTWIEIWDGHLRGGYSSCFCNVKWLWLLRLSCPHPLPGWYASPWQVNSYSVTLLDKFTDCKQPWIWRDYILLNTTRQGAKSWGLGVIHLLRLRTWNREKPENREIAIVSGIFFSPFEHTWRYAYSFRLKSLRALIDWHYDKQHVIWKRKDGKAIFHQEFQGIQAHKRRKNDLEMQIGQLRRDNGEPLKLSGNHLNDAGRVGQSLTWRLLIWLSSKMFYLQTSSALNNAFTISQYCNLSVFARENSLVNSYGERK